MQGKFSSLSASFLTKKPYFFVAHLLEYLGATAPLRTVYFASSRLELGLFILKTRSLLLGTKPGTLLGGIRFLSLSVFFFPKSVYSLLFGRSDTSALPRV